MLGKVAHLKCTIDTNVITFYTDDCTDLWETNVRTLF